MIWEHYAVYYPDQRYASALTVVRRECLLPEEAVGTVRVTEGKRVDVRDVVANGVIMNRHIILDAMSFFGLRRPQDLTPLLHVEPGELVEDRALLAGKNPQRGRRLFAPMRGLVAKIEQGRIIIHEMPQVIDLEAGVRGRVVEVRSGRGVVIEAVGAQIQGVWGNNRRTIATLRVEPEEGLESIVEDALNLKYKGVIVVTMRPLTAAALQIMEGRGLVGLIGPSMDASLRERALNVNGVIFLTEGFGSARMSRAIFNLLSQFDGQQVTIDAFSPTRWETRYPEIIVNITPRGDERPAQPNPMLSLRPNLNVRVTRDPYAGQTGRVVDLPAAPVLLENGLRVLCAQVELVAGGMVNVPLANLEVLGR
jgi:hypothetical protein